jgi:hypothetical protein
MLAFIAWPLLYVFAYFFLFYTIPVFFVQPRPKLPRTAWRTILFLIISVVLIFLFMEYIPNKELGNRIQHAVGGGMLAFYLYYRVVRDTHIKITPMQFFVLGFLTVTALGVANELFEFLLQSLRLHISAVTYDDTWLDLTSNTIGATLAGTWLTWWKYR